MFVCFYFFCVALLGDRWSVNGKAMKLHICLSTLLQDLAWITKKGNKISTLLQDLFTASFHPAAQPCATNFIQFHYIWHLAIEHFNVNSEVSQMNQMVESKSTPGDAPP